MSNFKLSYQYLTLFDTCLRIVWFPNFAQDMGDYGHHGVPNLASRLWSSLKLAAEISQISDANYPAA